MRGAWDLIVACKGSLVVAWRRRRLRTGLAGLLTALALVGVVGALWLLAGGGADDAAAPIDDGARLDRGDVGAGATGLHGTVPATPPRPGEVAPGSARSAGVRAAVRRASEPGPDATAVRPSGTTTTGSNRNEAPGPSTPATTVPPRSAPFAGTTTTTGPEAPPTEDSGAGGLGGLLGGVLDVLGGG